MRAFQDDYWYVPSTVGYSCKCVGCCLIVWCSCSETWYLEAASYSFSVWQVLSCWQLLSKTVPIRAILLAVNPAAVYRRIWQQRCWSMCPLFRRSEYPTLLKRDVPDRDVHDVRTSSGKNSVKKDGFKFIPLAPYPSDNGYCACAMVDTFMQSLYWNAPLHLVCLCSYVAYCQ